MPMPGRMPCGTPLARYLYLLITGLGKEGEVDPPHFPGRTNE